jgi:predicted PurR-regulated permease PerM
MKKEFVLLRFFIISCVWVASVLEVFLLPLVVGFFIALLFGPLVRWLEHKGV